MLSIRWCACFRACLWACLCTYWCTCFGTCPGTWFCPCRRKTFLCRCRSTFKARKTSSKLDTLDFERFVRRVRYLAMVPMQPEQRYPISRQQATKKNVSLTSFMQTVHSSSSWTTASPGKRTFPTWHLNAGSESLLVTICIKNWGPIWSTSRSMRFQVLPLQHPSGSQDSGAVSFPPRTSQACRAWWRQPAGRRPSASSASFGQPGAVSFPQRTSQAAKLAALDEGSQPVGGPALFEFCGELRPTESPTWSRRPTGCPRAASGCGLQPSIAWLLPHIAHLPAVPGAWGRRGNTPLRPRAYASHEGWTVSALPLRWPAPGHGRRGWVQPSAWRLLSGQPPRCAWPSGSYAVPPWCGELLCNAMIIVACWLWRRSLALALRVDGFVGGCPSSDSESDDNSLGPSYSSSVPHLQWKQWKVRLDISCLCGVKQSHLAHCQTQSLQNTFLIQLLGHCALEKKSKNHFHPLAWRI